MMNQSERTRKQLALHARAYPRIQIEDVFKFLYQSAFGCEHMVTSLPRATEYIKQEAAGRPDGDGHLIDPLDGDYSRVHLGYVNEGLKAETLAALFCLSAKAEPCGADLLEQKLDVAHELASQGALPFSPEEFSEARAAWRAQGYPPLHHSNTFREIYRPAYRVIANEYLPFLPLLQESDRLTSKETAVVAVAGGSASGKTTLGKLLSHIYDCTVLHMDDFFLRPEQRTPERLAEPGGNVDRERFLSEVLIPLSRRETISYRAFDCATRELTPPISITPKRLTVIEGAYAMHPALESYYELSVFLDVSPELQRERILKRNSPHMAERFFNEWIPLERLYFSDLRVRERCDLTIEIR